MGACNANQVEAKQMVNRSRKLRALTHSVDE